MNRRFDTPNGGCNARGCARIAGHGRKRIREHVWQHGPDSLRFPSFWRLQIAGGICLYVIVLVACVPELFYKPGVFRDNTISVAFMFLASFVLHPICRSLLRRSSSWLSFGLIMSIWSAIVGTVTAVVSTLVVLRFRVFDWTDLASNSVHIGVVLFLWCTLYFSIKQWQRSALERDRLLRARIRSAGSKAQRFALPAESSLPVQFAQCRRHFDVGGRCAPSQHQTVDVHCGGASDTALTLVGQLAVGRSNRETIRQWFLILQCDVCSSANPTETDHQKDATLEVIRLVQ